MMNSTDRGNPFVIEERMNRDTSGGIDMSGEGRCVVTPMLRQPAMTLDDIQKELRAVLTRKFGALITRCDFVSDTIISNDVVRFARIHILWWMNGVLEDVEIGRAHV